MLKRKWIPSQLPSNKVEPPLPPRPIRGSRSLFVVWLAVRIVWHVLTTKRPAPDDGLSLAQFMRNEFERLGGLWVKVAHVLSARRDAYPRTFCTELAKTTDFAIALSGESVGHTIRTEMGGSPNEIFREFDVVPIAATILSRLHIAWLREKDVKVAIKIQNPGSKMTLAQDLSILTKLTALGRFFRLRESAKLDEVVIELENWVRKSSDYRVRAGMMGELREKVRSKTVYVPKVFPRYCTERVLVMEFIDGVSVVDYERANRQFPKEMKNWRRTNGIHAGKLRKRLDTLMEYFLRDLSTCTIPRSIFILRNDRLAIVDVDVSASIGKKIDMKSL
ncbi:MAG TPA: AarF/UbiB family protein [Polyangium sp.]|nr:AarF/UbiB family protein [Polyangium sp.]